MRTTIAHFKLLADQSRVRILVLLNQKELCVCQIMGVLGMSQPLVSRNLSLLMKGGYLDNRRDGKMMFYALRKTISEPQQALMELLRQEISMSRQAKDDSISLKDCTKYQKKSGKCDMETYLFYMRQKKAGRKP